MNRKQFELLKFYTWQLKIATLGDLARWKAQHNARTNAETLDAMAKAYNGNEWATLYIKYNGQPLLIVTQFGEIMGA